MSFENLYPPPKKNWLRPWRRGGGVDRVWGTGGAPGRSGGKAVRKPKSMTQMLHLSHADACIIISPIIPHYIIMFVIGFSSSSRIKWLSIFIYSSPPPPLLSLHTSETSHRICANLISESKAGWDNLCLPCGDVNARNTLYTAAYIMGRHPILLLRDKSPVHCDVSISPVHFGHSLRKRRLYSESNGHVTDNAMS